MSQTAFFLTDYLFPGLLIGCGCLGLGVVNAIGHQPAPAPESGASADGPAVTSMQPARRARPAPRRVVARAASMSARPRVAPLRPMARPRRIRLAFGKDKTRVTDAQREQLRIFLATAKPGSEARFTVVGHGAGRRGLLRAKKRAGRVVALLRQLGVAAASIAEPQVVSDGGTTGPAVTIMIGKQ